MLFSRVLVANRGEIALRIIRACRELGIEPVAVYSEADADASYLRLADQKICLGEGPASSSYLDVPKIISAAEIANVDAIHPGYGFLSENAHFAEICESCNITFIGPSSSAMHLLGDKIQARKLAHQLGIPTIPGSLEALTDEKEALALAKEIGYPVMIKAAAGGGGRGMRLVHNDISLVNSFLAAQQEAKAAFGDSSLYLEKMISGARHIEVQILADRYGHIIHLGERDCSIQRRYQKIIEEAPSPTLTPSQREDLGEMAKTLARSAHYVTAGTLEFLMDEDERLYFIEMNTRLQVEHPVTEMVTGLDIVREQIKIASGEELGCAQEDVELHGTAMEARINAEDPENQFRPCPGKITAYIPPGGPGVRVDSHLYPGYTISPYYDSLIAKLIVHRKTRLEAITALKNTLGEFRIEGVKTNIPTLQSILAHTNFIKAKTDTQFLEKYVMVS